MRREKLFLKFQKRKGGIAFISVVKHSKKLRKIVINIEEEKCTNNKIK